MAQKHLELTHDFRFSGEGVADYSSPVETNAAKIQANFVELFAAGSVPSRVALDVTASFYANAAAITANFAALASAFSVSLDPIVESVDFLYTGTGVAGAALQTANAEVIDANFDAVYAEVGP